MGMDMTEKSCNEFIKEMADAGFDFSFRATNGNDVYLGDCKDGVVKTKRQLTAEQIKTRITERLSK